MADPFLRAHTVRTVRPPHRCHRRPGSSMAVMQRVVYGQESAATSIAIPARPPRHLLKFAPQRSSLSLSDGSGYVLVRVAVVTTTTTLERRSSIRFGAVRDVSVSSPQARIGAADSRPLGEERILDRRSRHQPPTTLLFTGWSAGGSAAHAASPTPSAWPPHPADHSASSSARWHDRPGAVPSRCPRRRQAGAR